ncbi:SDR family NAD(P)-dependent oxidoreductase [Rhodopila sp.]|uniref:SDR family NAD(P)-dependent oxidoreductase n=1 Tax=Rhodopila sp. TaxID=2480087 RepID=UPI003D105726
MTNPTQGTALITGASSGIGAVYADRLARRGHDLILVARDVARLEALAAALREQTGRTIDVLPADLADTTELARVQDRLTSDPAITMLVNNAGVSLNGSLLENGPDALQRLIAVNITAPTLLAHAAGVAFVERGAGTIVNIASVLAMAPELLDGVYSGSKAYLLNLSIDLAGRVGATGVRVQAVLPGATRTEIWQRSGKDADTLMPGKVMAVDDLVDAALLGLDHGETVTIPSLHDEALWTAYDAARLALAPNLSHRDVARRYRAATGRSTLAA